MPIAQIALRNGKSKAYRTALCDLLYQALREVLNVPEDDQFITITEHEAENFRYGNAFDITRSDDLVYVRITVFDSRTEEQKKALYRRLSDLYTEKLNLRPEDLIILVTDAPKENWSFGHGIAQFA